MATGISSLGFQLGIGPADTINYPPNKAGQTSIGSFSKYRISEHPETSNLIEGWKWDDRLWSDSDNEHSESYVPLIWDSSTSSIDSDYFQSGIGDNEDLELSDILSIPSSGMNSDGIYRTWNPVVKHGYYYDYQNQGYLFSDDSQTQYITYSGIASGLDLLPVLPSGFHWTNLSHYVKPGVPIKVRRFTYDATYNKYETEFDFKQKGYFTGDLQSDGTRLETYSDAKEAVLFENVDNVEPEFIVVHSGIVPEGYTTPLPAIILNGMYVNRMGESGLDRLEVLGISTGSNSERYHTSCSPIDRTMGIDIYSYPTTSGSYIKWEAIPSNTLQWSGYQAKVDYDLGLIEFGSSEVPGQQVPSAGHYIGASYFRTVAIEYEPDNTSDYSTGYTTNINPIYRRNGQGFVYLSTTEEYPASIELSAELPLVSTNVYGPLYVGNNFTAIVATVKDAQGELLEGQTVKFGITSTPLMGSFTENSTTAYAITDENGEATTYYMSPRSVFDISENITGSGITIDNAPVIPPGATQTTIFRTTTLPIRDDGSNIFLYGVHTDDPLQGFYDSGILNTIAAQTNEYYRKWFVDEDIYGPLGLSASGVTTSASISWEDSHRLLWNLSRPTIFESNSGMGKKVIVSILDSGALNPHTFTDGTIIPMQPSAVENVSGSIYDLTYDTSIYSIPLPSGMLNSYMVVAPTEVSLSASVRNNKLNRTITSNEISLQLDIPPYANGLWELELLNSLQLSEISSLITIAMEGKKVPFGFRIKSTNVTLAAALDGVTFLDLNRGFNTNNWSLDEVTPLRYQIEISGLV